MKQSGFTLVEVLIVVAILAVLSAISIPTFTKYKRNAAVAACNSDLGNCVSEMASRIAEGTAVSPTNTTLTATNGVYSSVGCPGFFGNAFSEDITLANDAAFKVNTNTGNVNMTALSNRSQATWGNNVVISRIAIDDNHANCSLIY